MAQLAIFENEYKFPGSEAVVHPMTGQPRITDSYSFEQVFKSNFRQLHAYAISFVRDHDCAEEIVQHVFYKFWKRYGTSVFPGPVTAYLYTAVHNESLNFLKHAKVRQQYQAAVVKMNAAEPWQATDPLNEKELGNRIRLAINELPEQCRTVFEMSRFQDLKYREISLQLGISVKTVENHMGKALRVLKEKLADYLPFSIILLNL